MKFILFSSLLGAFIFDTLFSPGSGGVIGLTLTNLAIFIVGTVLIVTEVLGRRLTGKNLTGVGFAIIIVLAVIFSLIYAQFNGVYSGSFIDNFRMARSYVFEPAVLFGLSFLLVDSREKGLRYLLFMVVVFGLLNIVSVVASHLGLEIFRVYETYAASEEEKERLAGFIGNPNKTAYLTCVLMAFQYYFYKLHKSRFVRSLVAIIMVGSVVVVLLSGSRGGFIVLLVVILGLAYRLRDMRVVYGAILLMPILVGMLLLTESTLTSNALERMTTIISSDASVATSGRNVIWSSLLADYVDSPIGMLFGNGFGAEKFMGIRAEPHNIYLMVLVDFGIIGLGLFLYFIFSLFHYVKKAGLGDDALRASVLASGYVVVFAWVFTTLVGVLDLVWFTIGIAMATLLSSSREGAKTR